MRKSLLTCLAGAVLGLVPLSIDAQNVKLRANCVNGRDSETKMWSMRLVVFNWGLKALKVPFSAKRMFMNSLLSKQRSRLRRYCSFDWRVS